MNRWEFMKELDNLLADIPEEERKEALNYYNDYFDDAGVENTAHVISELGSPSEVAAQIRAEFATALQPIENVSREKEPGDSTTAEGTWTDYKEGAYNKTESASSEYTYSNANETVGTEEKKKLSTGWIVLIVILCILASPALLGAVSGIFGVLVAIIAVILSLVAVFGAMTIACFVIGIVLFIGGIANCFSNPMGGIMAMGLGVLAVALGVLFLILTVLVAGGLIPAICKGIYSLFKKKKN